MIESYINDLVIALKINNIALYFIFILTLIILIFITNKKEIKNAKKIVNYIIISSTIFVLSIVIIDKYLKHILSNYDLICLLIISIIMKCISVGIIAGISIAIVKENKKQTKLNYL